MTRLFSLSLIATLVLSLLGCGGEQQDELVIYSGRSKALVDPLLEQYEGEVNVEVRYGSDAELLAALQEEGDQSPADVFWANTTGALGNAVNNDLLTELPDELMEQSARFAPTNQRWLPVTTRFRVLAYNSDTVRPEDLPDSVLDLPEHEEFEGRIGWTPAYSSFQDFVTALRVTEGEETARTWLTDMQALNPNSYSSNTPMIQALDAGEIDVGLTNHYYVLRLRYGDAKVDDEGSIDPEASVATHPFQEEDIGNLALVTGAGVLQTSDQSEAAREFLRFLMSDEAQSFAAETLNEYPLRPGAEVPEYMMPVDEALALSPDFDFERLQEMDPTLDLLRDVGAL
ncbi:MAG: iron ABC transporter substrate-binding protein [Salinibacter sp.]|uniref:iron ABC transporter substrate-binding protein n=1 Tax=Salinibacter sp. TaxID=2065818 RepID=UPI002FC3C1F8